MIDLSKLATLDLLQELERREGVWVHVMEPFRRGPGEEKGAAVVLVEPWDMVEAVVEYSPIPYRLTEKAFPGGAPAWFKAYTKEDE